jgi:sulfite exporter TauE/SafE
MHCAACERIVADTLVQAGIGRSARASLASGEVLVESEDGAEHELFSRAREALEPRGYLLVGREEGRRRSSAQTLAGLGIAAGILAAFALLQYSGAVQVLAPHRLDVGGAFALGIVASLSSCFALVGGLMMTYTASLARSDRRLAWIGQGLFHATRIVAFVVLGGALGALGSAASLTPAWTQVLHGAAILIMLLLGLRLLGVYRGRLGGNGVTITTWARRWAEGARLPAGALLGVASFFLPCGFTQSMQFQALAAGSLSSGALLLGVFALGTLPVLGLLSTTLVRGFGGKGQALLTRSAGFLVLGLGLYQAWNFLTALGIRLAP